MEKTYSHFGRLNGTKLRVTFKFEQDGPDDKSEIEFFCVGSCTSRYILPAECDNKFTVGSEVKRPRKWWGRGSRFSLEIEAG
jgi:hypothetical protein